MPKVMVAPPEVLVRIRNSCLSFFKKNFNTNSLLLAIFFSLPIYINYNLTYIGVAINFGLKILFTLILFLALYFLVHREHKWFASGFFIGLFWFWWIGLSFRYYGLAWMVPFADIMIAVFYGTVFWIFGRVYGYFKRIRPIAAKIFLLLVFVFGFDYLSPFTFDWLKPEVLFVNTFFPVYKLTMLLVAGSFIFYKELRYFCILLIAAAFFTAPQPLKPPALNIYVSSTFVPQELKWNKKYIPYEVKNNFDIIKKALKEKKDVVILPESAFPMFLNRHADLMDRLKALSEKIVIITGALHLKENRFYNSTYVFNKGRVAILDKHMLVPFGEYIPLPFFQKEINEIFFAGASDYSTSEKFGTFSIGKYRFANAICYEATVEKLYKLKPSYIVALSNVAWFMPSIMPSLQQMLIKVYAQKHKKIVYHSINGFKGYIVNN